MQMKEPEEFCLPLEAGLDHARAASLCFGLKKKNKNKKALNVTAKSVHAQQNMHSKRAAQTG